MLEIEHTRHIGVAKLVGDFHKMPTSKAVVILLLGITQKRRQQHHGEYKNPRHGHVLDDEIAVELNLVVKMLANSLIYFALHDEFMHQLLLFVGESVLHLAED